MDENGQEGLVPNNLQFIGTEVAAIQCYCATTRNRRRRYKCPKQVSKFGASADKLLDKPATLMQLKMTDPPTIFYTYMNSKVDTGLTNQARLFRVDENK